MLHCTVLFQDGYTALLCAAAGGKQEIVSLLLERGANIGVIGEVKAYMNM
jgi:ankyrin repeat protein